MAFEIKLPSFGRTVEEAVVVDRLISPNQHIKKGDIIFELEVDKAAFEMHSPADGFVKHILVETGQTVLVDQPLLILGKAEEEVAPPAIERIARSVQKSADCTDTSIGVENYTLLTELPVEEIKLGTTIPLNHNQKIIAQKMLRSKQQKPCFYLSVKVDVTDLVEYRDRLNKSADTKISFNAFFIRAAAAGLEHYPILAGRLNGEKIELPTNINIGLAISSAVGLVVPVIKEPARKSLRQIAEEVAALSERANKNKLLPADLQDSCFTISNLGAFGTDWFIPIVLPEQCAILGIGRITRTCMPDDGNIVVRKLMTITISADHRITNGAYAAQFLDMTRDILEDISNFKNT